MLEHTSSGYRRGARWRIGASSRCAPRTSWRSALALMSVSVLVACGSGGGSGSSDAPTGEVGAVKTPPEAVAGLVAKAGNSPTVTLTWAPSKGADGYIIYWSETRGVTPATGQAIQEVTSPFVHEGLSAGKPYHYVVTAVNSAGVSPPSAEVSALLPPGAPAGVTALPGDSSNTVSWQAVPQAERYRVYWSTQPGVSKATSTVVDLTAGPLLHAGLQNGTPYYYVVTAVGAGGEGPVSAQVSATPRIPVPGAPRDLTAQASPDNARSILLSWLVPTIPANSADIIGYRIYRSTQPDIVSNLAAATRIDGSTQTSLIDAVPIGGITYYYIVTALTAAGESAPSAEVSTTSGDDSSDGGGSGGGSGGGGSFDCGEPVLCWKDSTAS